MEKIWSEPLEFDPLRFTEQAVRPCQDGFGASALRE